VVSVTPMKLDFTDHESLAQLREMKTAGGRRKRQNS
jgi:hypothetical protein